MLASQKVYSTPVLKLMTSSEDLDIVLLSDSFCPVEELQSYLLSLSPCSKTVWFDTVETQFALYSSENLNSEVAK